MKSSLRLLIVFGLIFVMSVPSWAEEIYVCYNERTGDVRYVDSPSDCRPNENSISINTEGPEGPAGSDGIDGINCWDLNGNGDCDLASEDVNTDSVCDAVDCQGPEGPAGPTGGFDLSKIYVKYCDDQIDDGVRLVECLCDDDGSKAISGAVSCGQFWYPIHSNHFVSPYSGAEGWTALCKNLIDDSQFGPDTFGVICIRP